jgi:release factor glutamine methyltransferase
VSDSGAEPATIGAALGAAIARLAEAGIARPQAEARLLLEAAGGGSRAELIAFPERRLAAPQLAGFEAMVARRCRHEPASRILGKREFWSLTFSVTPATLDPRPDSETLVAAVLARLHDRQARLSILDLGTGTGCLLLALLSELPQAEGVGIDISPEAVATAQENAQALGLAKRASIRAGSWCEGLASARFDVVVSNPPYIAHAEIAGLQPEVAGFDPPRALDGGADGLDAYRALLPGAAHVLKPGGLLALEIGMGQGPAVKALAERGGVTFIGSAQDLAGIERCLLFSRNL